MSAIAEIPELRQRVFARLDDGLPGRMVLISADPAMSHDAKLNELVKALGALASNLINHENMRCNLGGILGICFGWSMSLGTSMPFDKIHDERERQQRLFLDGFFSFTCVSPVVDPVRKLRILSEEVGEVANAIDELESGRQGQHHLKTELIQVAAVAVAWLESLEPKQS